MNEDKLTNNQKILIYIFCSLEQMAIVGFTSWMVIWNGWSHLWYVLAFLFILVSTPRRVAKFIERKWTKSNLDGTIQNKP